MEDAVGVAARLGEIEGAFECLQRALVVVQPVARHRLDEPRLDRGERKQRAAAAVQVRGHALDGGLWMPRSELERGDADRQVGGIPVRLELGEHRPCALGLAEHEPELGLHQSARDPHEVGDGLRGRLERRAQALERLKRLAAHEQHPRAYQRNSGRQEALAGSAHCESALSANCSAFSSSCRQRCTTASET